MIPYGRQNVTDEDVRAVVDVLNSDFLTQGPIVEKFEQKISEKVNCGFRLPLTVQQALFILLAWRLD